ncbi:hypothetical protein L0F63_002761, partial [Massospora cicadina]
QPSPSDPRTQLILTLIQASSSQAGVIRHAVTILKGWETTPGFYPTLQITYDSSLELGPRLQAIVYLKKGVALYWRKSAFNGIPPNDKSLIRSRLLSGILEPLRQLAIQNSVIISKVSRLDYPKEWSDVIDGLIERTGECLDEPSRLQHIRAPITIHLVIKALASKVYAAWKARFEAV